MSKMDTFGISAKVTVSVLSAVTAPALYTPVFAVARISVTAPCGGGDIIPAGSLDG
jgi:hypothetical protein